MTEDEVCLDDHVLLRLYECFQRIRKSLGEMYPSVPHDNFIDQGSYVGRAMPIVLTASEHVLSASNAVNRFNYDLHGLTAWAEVLNALTEDEKLQALFEFVAPAAAHCLSAPYSIKQMFIKSISKLSHQTNQFVIGEWGESSLKPDRQLDFTEAKKLAAGFATWTEMCNALSRLNDEQFRSPTDDYRNRLNHGFPRRIEFGRAITVQWNADAKSYALHDTPSLSIAFVIPLLARQYHAATDCYRAYISFVREQHQIWSLH